MAEELTVTVETLGTQGDGMVRRTDGGLLFIPFAMPGETVRVAPTGTRAQLLEVLNPSPQRQAPLCPHFTRCGGCMTQHLPRADDLQLKRERLLRALSRVGVKLDGALESDSVPPASRRRATFVAERQRASLALGFHPLGSRAIVEVEACAVLRPVLLSLLPALRKILAETLPMGARADVLVADTENGLDVVLTTATAPGLAERAAFARFAEELDLARLSYQPDPISEPETLVQRRAPTLTLSGTTVALPAGGFLQATAEGEESLVTFTRDALSGARRVMDLFCGIGPFGLAMAAAGAKVSAMDSDAAAIAALSATRRVTAVVRDLFRQPLTQELKEADAVIFDPPRTGAEGQARALQRRGPERVVAISCDPETFARDASFLQEGGYRLSRLKLVDQFLFAPHLEIAALFER